jgi:hypothetical protein
MKRLLIAGAIVVLACSVADAAKRKHVRIYKPSPPAPAQQPATIPLIAVPPAAVAFDLIRRTSCDPRIAVSTGKGDPGFDLVNGPKTGNFLIPAIWERCATRPQPR